MLRRFLPIPLAIAASLAWSIGVQAAVQFNQNVPLNVTEFNPCTGEVIVFSGTIHFVAAETASTNGGFHMIFQDNVHDVRGVSDTGTMYRGVGGDWFEINAVPPFPFEATMTDVFGLISQGSTANFKVITTMHITVNANGTVTSTVSDVRFSCNG